MAQRLVRVAAPLLLASLLAGCCTTARPPLHAPPAPATQSAARAAAPFVNARLILIVRHADIDLPTKAREGNATPLLDRGQQRARELAYALRDAGITRIITTEALRTQQTAAILADNLHITPENPFVHGPGSAPAPNEVARYLARTTKPSDILLLVHHHSVIPSIMKDFGFPDEPPITDATEFDRLYLLLPDPATRTYRLVRARYGGNWNRDK